MIHRLTTSLLLINCLLPITASTQTYTPQERLQIANLEQDLQILRSEVLKLKQRLETLEAENNTLKQTIAKETQARNNALDGFATSAQLAREINALKTQYTNADAKQTTDILNQINQTLDAFAKQTENTLKTIANNQINTPPNNNNTNTTSTFTDNFPKTGVEYIVQPGDTLSAIASRHNSTIQYIVDANQISRPNALKVGRKLFIPQD